MKSSDTMASGKSPERGNQAKSRGPHGRKYQAEGNKVGWEAESKCKEME